MEHRNKSSRANKATLQDAKPFPGFPLTAHETGSWAKSWKGKRYYFGPVDDWQGALDRFKREWAAITTGLPIPTDDSDTECTLQVLCNAFLNSKRIAMESGDIAARTFHEYHRATDALIAHFGR